MPRSIRVRHPMRQQRWIQKAIEKPGALHKQLEIPSSEVIPRSYLERIAATPIGEVAENPTRIGKAKVRVTGTLKKRTVLALTLTQL